MEDFISKLGIPVLETALPDSSKFRKEGMADRRFSVLRSNHTPSGQVYAQRGGTELMSLQTKFPTS